MSNQQDGVEMKEERTYEARVCTTALDELQASQPGLFAPLPQVSARSPREAAERAAAWYGEEGPVGADGASVLLSARLVEVREIVALPAPPAAWESFVVTKRLVVQRSARPVPTGRSWLTLLDALWRRFLGGKYGVGGALIDLEECRSWRSGARVLFELKCHGVRSAHDLVALDEEQAVVVSALEALLPAYLEVKARLEAIQHATRPIGGSPGALDRLRALQVDWVGMTEADKAAMQVGERALRGLRLTLADWRRIAEWDPLACAAVVW
ncbi:MAG: hypothetical protein E6Q97_20155 [Desulfurellales bacterium]|nr:MAG: hypothetical protein E6Q97_20155 [Desulfurellales bacterium]